MYLYCTNFVLFCISNIHFCAYCGKVKKKEFNTNLKLTMYCYIKYTQSLPGNWTVKRKKVLNMNLFLLAHYNNLQEAVFFLHLFHKLYRTLFFIKIWGYLKIIIPLICLIISELYFTVIIWGNQAGSLDNHNLNTSTFFPMR